MSSELRSDVEARAGVRIETADLELDEQLRGRLYDVLVKLPEDIREMALEHCFFTAIGPDVGGFYILPRSLETKRHEEKQSPCRLLVVLNAAWRAEEFQGQVAHEIAHVSLGHEAFPILPQQRREQEATAAALAREWGFPIEETERPQRDGT
jgi:hypothetical protein